MWHCVSFLGVGLSLFACQVCYFGQSLPRHLADPEHLRRTLQANARGYRTVMIVQTIAMIILLLLSLDIGMRQWFVNCPTYKKPKIPAKLLLCSTIVVQLTIIALLAVFIREAINTGQPWQGDAWLHPWWVITVDGLMVCIPLGFIVVLDAAHRSSRLGSKEPEMAIQGPVVLTVVDNRPPPP
jgi:hypothetical protein